ncbi:hypothetical protein DRQ32_03320 [bacterium]|nr:MAG: hypothetical protein DRQ32_03320 [bacterium]
MARYDAEAETRALFRQLENAHGKVAVGISATSRATRNALRAAYEAGRVEGAEEMRKRSVLAVSKVVVPERARYDENFCDGHRMAANDAAHGIAALPTSPETLDATGEVE